MTVRTEYEELAQERAKIARRQSARQRSMVRWFVRIGPSVDHFTWRDPFAEAPAIEEFPT